MRPLFTLLFFCTLIYTGIATANTYTVQPGESMWEVAAKHTQGKVTTHQMIAAIHELNAAKLGSNIDNIPAGMTLEIPSIETAEAADSSRATALLSGNDVYSPQTAAQAQALIVKIENIQSQINQAMKDITATKTTFTESVTQ